LADIGSKFLAKYHSHRGKVATFQRQTNWS